MTNTMYKLRPIAYINTLLNLVTLIQPAPKLDYSFCCSRLPLPQNAMLAKLTRRAVKKKLVVATLPINIAFGGEGGGGCNKKM